MRPSVPWVPDRPKIELARFWHWAIAEREALGGRVRNDAGASCAKHHHFAHRVRSVRNRTTSERSKLRKAWAAALREARMRAGARRLASARAV